MSSNQKTFYIEGNIASGKSTFCKWIENNFYDFVDVVYEPVDQWTKAVDKDNKNLLDYFYKDAKRWAYTFQMMAFTSRVEALEKSSFKPIRCVDRSIYCDKNVFAQNCYDTGLFTEIEWKLYKDMYNFIDKRFKYKPSCMIYLKTKPETCVERIKKRARSEESSVPLDYLKQIHEKHENWLNNKEWHIPVITINESDIDYQDEKKMKKIKDMIINLFVKA